MVSTERETRPGERIVEAARALLGTRFRPQGCSAAGVDCVGLVFLALEGAGLGVPFEPTHGMRFQAPEAAEVRLRRLGLRAVAPAGRQPGDIILCEPAPGQLHFAIATAAGVIEAHAGLRRVVERPWRPDERIRSVWRAG